MRKIALLCICTLALSLLFTPKPKSIYDFNVNTLTVSYVKDNAFYYKEMSKAELHELSSIKSIKIKGESVFIKDKTAKDIIDYFEGEIVNIETYEDGKSYYVKSKYIDKSICLFSKSVNMQISQHKDGVTVGIPIIFSGF